MPEGYVDIRRLKQWAIRQLPQESHLRALLLAEEDRLATSEFLGRLPAWDRLAMLEASDRA